MHLCYNSISTGQNYASTFLGLSSLSLNHSHSQVYRNKKRRKKWKEKRREEEEEEEEEEILMAGTREKTPAFFKVLMEECTNKLKIPPTFYMHFDANGPQQSLLRTPIGTWSVHVQKLDDGFFFQKGWKKFVHDHDLKLCEFLIFRYVGNSNFDVDIYGRNGCNKVFAMANRVIDIESDTSMDMDDSETEEDQEDSEIGLPKARTQGETQIPSEAAGPARALEAANKYSSNNPFFKAVMCPSNVKKQLHVPRSFRDYIGIGRTTFVTLQDSKRLRWPVKCIYDCYSCRFSSGWYTFVKYHALKVGDVCVFEVIKRNDFVFKVSIFRCGS